MTLELYFGRIPLSTYGAYGDLSPTFDWTEGQGGGLGNVSWTQPALAGAQIVPNGYIAGAQLELRDSGVRLGQCIVSTVDFTTGSFTASGVYMMPSKLSVLACGTVTDVWGTHENAPVYNVHDAVVNAIARGKLPGWRDPGDLPTTDLRTLATAPLDAHTSYNLLDLMTAQCRSVSATTRWYVDAAGFPRFDEDPTTPSLLLNDVAPLGLTSDNYVTDLVVTYQSLNVDESTGAFVNDVVTSSRPAPNGLAGSDSTLDITSAGPLTEEQAQDYADTALARMLPEFARDGSATVLPDQVTLFDGTPVPLSLVTEGVMVKQPGARVVGGAQIPGLADQWIIGSITLTSSNGRITGASLTPFTSTTDVEQLIMSTAVQAQLSANQAQQTAQDAANGDPLLGNSTPESSKTFGPTIPAAAELGDFFLDSDDSILYVCTTAYASGGSLEANWTEDDNATTRNWFFATIATSTSLTNLILGTMRTLSEDIPSGTPVDGQTWTQVDDIDPTPPTTPQILGEWIGHDGVWVVAPPGSTWIAAAVVSAVAGYFTYLSAGAITAATVRTAASGGRIEMVPEATYGGVLNFYNGSGTLAQQIYGGAGYLALVTATDGNPAHGIAPFIALYEGSPGAVAIAGNTNFTDDVTVDGGINVGTATTATTGDVIASGSVASISWITSGTGMVAPVFIASGGGQVAGTKTALGFNASNATVLALGDGLTVKLNAGAGPSGIAKGALYADSSSREFKTGIESILEKYPPEILRQVAGVLYRWVGHDVIADGTRDAGFVAQEIHGLGIVELVAYNAFGNPAGVHYDRAVAFLWSLTNWLADRVDNHDDRMDAHDSRLAALEAALNPQEAA